MASNNAVTGVTTFPPVVWSSITSYLDGSDVTALLATGNSSLKQTLELPGSVTFIKLHPKESADVSLPMVIRIFPRLVTLEIHLTSLSNIPFRKLKAKRMPQSLEKLVVTTPSPFPSFFQSKSGSWVDCSTLLPYLDTLSFNIDVMDASTRKWIQKLPPHLSSLQIGKWQIAEALVDSLTSLTVSRLVTNSDGMVALPENLKKLEILDRTDLSTGLPCLIPALGRNAYLETLHLGPVAYNWKRAYFSALPRTLTELSFGTKNSNELVLLYEEEEKLIEDSNRYSKDAVDDEDDPSKGAWKKAEPASPRPASKTPSSELKPSSLKLSFKGLNSSGTVPPAKSITSVIGWPERLVSLDTTCIPLEVWNTLPRTLTFLKMRSFDMPTTGSSNTGNEAVLPLTSRQRRQKHDKLCRQLSALPRGLLHLIVSDAPGMRLNGPIDPPPLLKTWDLRAIQLDYFALNSFGPTPRTSASKTASSVPKVGSPGDKSAPGSLKWNKVSAPAHLPSRISKHRNNVTSPRSSTDHLETICMRLLDERLVVALPSSVTTIKVDYLASLSPQLVAQLPPNLAILETKHHDHQWELFDEENVDYATPRQGPPSPRSSMSTSSSSESESSEDEGAESSDGDLPLNGEIMISPRRATLAVRAHYDLPKSLTELSLGDFQQLGDGLIESLSKNSVANLRRLSLRQAALVSDMCVLWLPKQLEILEIDASENMTGAMFADLPKTNLKVLSLASATSISDDQLLELPSGLTYLNLANATHVTDEGIRGLPKGLAKIIFTKNKLITHNAVRFLHHPIHHKPAVTFASVEPSFVCDRFSIINAQVKSKGE